MAERTVRYELDQTNRPTGQPWVNRAQVSCRVLPLSGRVVRDLTPDELVRLCGEDAPEQCKEFEDESGRWHRV